MKNIILLVLSGLVVLLATACSPVVYESPGAGYPVIIESQPPVVVTHHPPGHIDKAHRKHHARIERELNRRHQHVAHIYQGYGRPGELVRIELRGGYLWHNGRRVRYSPISFMIATGDIIRLPTGIVDVDLFVRYENGFISLDTDIFGRFSHTVAHLGPGSDWSRERSYRVDNRHIRGARVIVKAVPGKHAPRKKNKHSQSPKYGHDRHVTDHKHHAYDVGRGPENVLTRKKEVRHGDRERERNVATSPTDKRRAATQREIADAASRRQQVSPKDKDRGPHARRDGNTPDKVKVVFGGGTVQRDGRRMKLERGSVTLERGQTKQARLAVRDGRDVSLPVTYREGRVIVDSERGQQKHTFRVNRKGAGPANYDLRTQGRTRLDNVRVEISAL